MSNMQRLDVDIANGFYESFSPQMADLVCKNLRPFVPEAAAYSQTGLRSTDGIVEAADTTYKTSRGAVEAQGFPYFVQGNQLIRLNKDGSRTDFGAISGTGRVSMAASKTIIWIVVPDGDSYYFNINTQVLTQNLDPNFLGPATGVAFYSSFFFFCTREIIFNANLDGVTFTSTDLGTAEVNPDIIQNIVATNGEFYAIGTETIQPYQPVGGSGFPIQAIPSSTIERGMSSVFGFVKADNTFFFIGGGDQQEVGIFKFLGNNAVKISTPAVDHFMQGESDDDIKSVFAWSYQTEGEEFVGFTFPNRTFVYQVEASKLLKKKIWHERSSFDTRWRVNTVVRAFNRIYVGDERTAKIGVINPDVYTEYGDVQHRKFVSQPFNFKGAPTFVNSYEMIMATGVGNSLSTNPVVDHSYSDNGINFTPKLTREMGEGGNYNHRVVWRRMGRIPNRRVLAFETHEPVETTFYVVQAEVGGSSAAK